MSTILYDDVILSLCKLFNYTEKQLSFTIKCSTTLTYLN